MAPNIDDPNSRTRREDAPDFYQWYLGTSDWRTIRNRALARAGYRCQRCGSKRDPNVHHLSYARLGAELDADLEVLCFVCHRGHHKQEASSDGGLGVYLRIVSVIIDEDPFARLADLSETVKATCARLKIPARFDLIHKAIQIETGARLFEPKRVPYESVVEAAPDAPPPSHAQAVELLTRLRVQLRGPDAAVKTMPKVKMVTQSRADQLKAFAMVTREIEDSIARCEALESAASDRSDA
jgi:hypothetical protein